jgi:hypothetical protein
MHPQLDEDKSIRCPNLLMLTFSLSILEGRSFLGLPPAAAMAAATLAAVDIGNCGQIAFEHLHLT